MRVLDLFSGLGGFSQPFKDRGHTVTTLDIDPKFKPDIVADVLKLSSQSLPLAGEWDVILASPPCQMFSIARAWHGWPPEDQRDALGVVAATFRLIAELRPRWVVVENPRGFLRQFIGLPRQTVMLCNFGGKFQKPTDLWGKWPGGRLPDPRPCAPHKSSPNGEVAIKACVEHGAVASSSRAFALTPSGAARAKLPYGLGEEFCRRMEGRG